MGNPALLLVLLAAAASLFEKVKGRVADWAGLTWAEAAQRMPAVLLVALYTVLAVLAVAAAALAVVAAVRLWYRKRRADEMVTAEVILGPDDTAEPFEVMSLFDSLYTLLLTRYWRFLIGQPTLAWEVYKGDDSRIHLLISCQARWMRPVQAAIQSKYTNVRFQSWHQEGQEDWPVCQQIRLRYHWSLPLRSQRNYQNSVMESIIAVMEGTPGQARLQFLLAPRSLAAQRELKKHLWQREHEARGRQAGAPQEVGIGYSEDKELKGGLEMVGKGLFQSEIRLASSSWDMGQAIYAALGESAGENRLVAARVYFLRRLWLRWFRLKLPSLALFKASVLSSFHLATLVHLPTARIRVQGLNRSLIRRGVAPRDVPRDPRRAIVQDEHGVVSILEEDRKFNILTIGAQGSGKTTIEEMVFIGDVRAGDKCVVLIDTKGTLAERALGYVPPDRQVYYFDPADERCPWSLAPLAVDAPRDIVVGQVIDDLRNAYGADAIGPRSDEILGNFMLALLEVQGRTSFSEVYALMADPARRARIAEQVQDPYQKLYWQSTLPELQRRNPRFLEEALSAPRNKLAQVLRTPAMARALDAGKRLDLRQVIRDRAILIANLSKDRLTEPNAFLMGRFLITGLWHAIHSQSQIPAAERVPVSLIADEAHNYLSISFMHLLAEGREFGAQSTVAIQFLSQIGSEPVREALLQLVQNFFVFQTQSIDDAKHFARLTMRVYADAILASDEHQDRLNFGPDDFLRLPAYHCIARLKVRGVPQQAFTATTIPPHEHYHEEWRGHHLNANRLQVSSGAQPAAAPYEGPRFLSLLPVSPQPAPEPVEAPLPVTPSAAEPVEAVQAPAEEPAPAVDPEHLPQAENPKPGRKGFRAKSSRSKESAGDAMPAADRKLAGVLGLDDPGVEEELRKIAERYKATPEQALAAAEKVANVMQRMAIKNPLAFYAATLKKHVEREKELGR